MEEAIWQILVVILIAAVAVEALLLIAIMRQLGGLIVQLRPARIGEVEHDEGPEVGSEAEVPGLHEGRPAIVLFLSTECSICRPLLPSIPVVRQRYPEIEILSIVAGQDTDERMRIELETGIAARQDLLELQSDWRIPGTPFAVAIDAEGRVDARGVVNSLDQLEGLAESLLHRQGDTTAGDIPRNASSGDDESSGTPIELAVASEGRRAGETG